MRKSVLNSKSMFSRNRLPRLAVEKEDWEKRKEEREKDNEKQETKRRRDDWLRSKDTKHEVDGREEQLDIDRVLELQNEKTWDAQQLEKEKGEKWVNMDDLYEEEQPKKRKRRERGWRKEERHDWGLEDVGSFDDGSDTSSYSLSEF